MLEGGVSGQDGVVGLDNSGGDLNERKNNVKTMLKFAQLTKKMERVNEKNPKKQLIWESVVKIGKNTQKNHTTMLMAYEKNH